MEIFCSEQWGTVCDDYFNEEAATTVCMQLGYNAVEVWHTGRYVLCSLIPGQLGRDETGWG